MGRSQVIFNGSALGFTAPVVPELGRSDAIALGIESHQSVHLSGETDRVDRPGIDAGFP